MHSRQIVRRRLEAQRISSTQFTRADEVVAWLGAVQAQDYLGALWAVGLRMTDAREADVERALAERRIVRTWPMRGTLHFVAASDARWTTELLAPRVAAAGASRLRSFGIDDAVLSRARRVLAKSLEGGRRLTRPATYRALERAGIAAGSQRGLHILWRLAQECFVCFGPRDRKQQTFVLFDEWLPRAEKLPRDAALATLASRYFTSHGPATLRDFAWWSGLTIADARRAILCAGDRIVETLLGGNGYWSGGSGSIPGRMRPAGTHVLPPFDEFLVGYTDRSAALPPTASGRMTARGIFSPVVIVDGRGVATWTRRSERDNVVCSVAPFGSLDAARSKAVERALERYARFVGRDLRLEAVDAS